MAQTIPLSVPDDLLAEVQTAADETHLSMQDVFRQSARLGLPKLREQLARRQGRLTNVEPLSDAILERLYRERDDEDDSIRRFISAQPKGAE